MLRVRGLVSLALEFSGLFMGVENRVAASGFMNMEGEG